MDQQLQQAIRALRGIRQRYETGRDAGLGYLRSYNVQVALGYADMIWISATIEALEKAAAASSVRKKFASTCPKCGEERLQPVYSRRMLLTLLKTRRKIDAYCIVCNVCWPITESERRVIFSASQRSNAN